MLTEEKIVQYFIIAKLHLYSLSLRSFRGKLEPAVFTDSNPVVIRQIRKDVQEHFGRSFTPGEIFDAVAAYQNPGKVPQVTERPAL